MELNKKKYKKEEVREILVANNASYEEKLAEQKTRIYELLEENQKLLIENKKLKSRQSLVDSAILTAEKTAQEKNEQTQLEYKLNRERLINFSERWTAYFDYLRETYPLYSATKEATEIFDSLCHLLKINNDRQIVDDLNAQLEGKLTENMVFEPQKKIAEYVSATSENGFNIEEVLNPGELHLEELCRELGLIDEE